MHEIKEKLKSILEKLGLLRLINTIKLCFTGNIFLGMFRFYFKPKKEIVLITGCMRTGTTLLKALMAEADDVSHLSEVSFGRYAAAHAYFALFSIYSLSEKRIIVLKQPVWFDCYEDVPFERQFLRIKIIITVRHPYDTVLSLKNMPPERTYTELVEYWSRTMDHILSDQRLLSHDVLFLKYEEVVKNPLTETERIFKFIGSSRSEGVSSYGTSKFEWKWGKDDGGEKIKTGKVQEIKNASHKPEVSELLKNNKEILELAKKFNYSI